MNAVVAPNLQGSYPSDAAGAPVTTAGATNPRYWSATFLFPDLANQVFALCVPN